jgi:hypothetical protein
MHPEQAKLKKSASSTFLQRLPLTEGFLANEFIVRELWLTVNTTDRDRCANMKAFVMETTEISAAPLWYRKKTHFAD